MSKIDVSVLLPESDTVIKSRILRAFIKEVNDHVANKIDNIRNSVRSATFNFYRGTETYDSLVNGELAGHFGLPLQNRQNNIDTILSTISNSIEVTFKPFKLVGSNIVNGLTIRVLLSDFSDILALPQATIITEKGDALDWLRWLLLAGDKIIIKEYEVDIRPGDGRSGMGLMVSEQGGVWRVPPEFSGTMNNNWLTRTLVENSQPYLSILGNIIRKELQGI